MLLHIYIINLQYNIQGDLTMRRHYFLLQKLLLLLFYLESLIVMQAEHKQYFWVVTGIVAIFSYALEGARPYTPAFLVIFIADLLQINILQTLSVAILGLIMMYLGFYHIEIVGKGPYNAGYRYHKSNQGLQFGIFYPSMSDGKNCKWIPTQKYSQILYDLTFIDPTKPRYLPKVLFNFVTSFLVKIEMPVLGNASLYINDYQKYQKWKVIMFSHGLGSNMTNFSALCGWWASHGYIVISVQHHNDKIRIDFGKQLLQQLDILQRLLYNSRNSDLLIRANQMQAVIDHVLARNLLGQIFSEVKKQIKIESVFLSGHSFGGTTVLETMANLITKNKYIPLIKGIIGLDAWYFPLSQSTYKNLSDQNILLLNSESFFGIVPRIYRLQQKMGSLREKNKNTLKAFVVKNTDHLSYCDFAFAMGGLLKYKKQIKLQQHTIPIMQLHQIAISLFMQGKSTKQILQITNKQAQNNGLMKLGVQLMEQWRYSKKQE